MKKMLYFPGFGALALRFLNPPRPAAMIRPPWRATAEQYELVLVQI